MAHVLATVGLLGAFGAGAAEPTGASLESSIATEELASGYSAIHATPMGRIVINEKVDTILEGTFYLVLDFGNARLTRDLPLAYTAGAVGSPGDADTAGTAGVLPDANGENAVAAVDPVVGSGTGFRIYHFVAATTGNAAQDPGSSGIAGSITNATYNFERAFRGTEGESVGVWKLTADGSTDIDLAVDAHIRLELGTQRTGTGATAVDAGYLEIPQGVASYGYELSIWNQLGAARAVARGEETADDPVYEGSGNLFSTASSLATAGATVSANLLTADVAHANGPFLGFMVDADSMTTANVGNLATITLTPDTFAMFLDTNAAPLTSMKLTGADIEVTADAGSFGFGVGAGSGPNGEVEITGDDPDTMEVEDDTNVLNAGGAPTAFMISSSAACMDNALMLSNAAGDAVNPNADMNPVVSADATMGTASVSGVGPHYFCVLTENAAGKANEVAIPAIGDDDDLDAYTIEVTTKGGEASGPVETGNGGAIERNGTTLNITFLSVHEAYNQRLVIVNRGEREAEFWMDTFQTEAGTMVLNEIRGKVAGKSRTVIRVQDALEVNEGGVTRASGTMNLTAPARMIDVMTLQVHPGTGQIDTTIYQHTR